jgi:hypothetical protein
MPTSRIEPEDGAGPRPDRDPADSSRATPATRLQIRTSGWFARHPALLTVLERLGRDNPGGSMNP